MMPLRKTVRAEVIIFAVLSLAFTLLHLDNPFFWDNIIQMSVPANWYFENGFRHFFLPDEIATGHPTLAGAYLAIIWKIFGRSLAVSHLAMIPFIFGLIYQLYIFVRNNISSNKRELYIILVFVFLDASLLAQLSLVTFDIIHLFFLFLSINSLLYRKNLLFILSYTGLMAVSLRGTISGTGLLIFYFLYLKNLSSAFSLKHYLKFIPGMAFIILYLLVFYLEKNWVIHNTVSRRWGDYGQLAGIDMIIRNAGIFIWRLIDFGRIGVWIIYLLILSSIIGRDKQPGVDKGFLTASTLAFSQLALFLPLTIMLNNPIGHRYLLPIIIPVIIASVHWIYNYSKHRLIILLATGVLMLGGHFLIYPEKTAQGWDSTTAHWPYYELRGEMMSVLEEEGIEKDSVSSFFPNTASGKYTDLNNDEKGFSDFEFSESPYVLYSNIYNVSDEVIDELFHSGSWAKKDMTEKRNIYMILFKRNEY